MFPNLNMPSACNKVSPFYLETPRRIRGQNRFANHCVDPVNRQWFKVVMSKGRYPNVLSKED